MLSQSAWLLREEGGGGGGAAGAIRPRLKALFHSSQKQACCENFHPITIFESHELKIPHACVL